MRELRVGDRVKIKAVSGLFDIKYSVKVFTITAISSRYCNLDNKYLYRIEDVILYIPDNTLNRLLYPELTSEEGMLV